MIIEIDVYTNLGYMIPGDSNTEDLIYIRQCKYLLASTYMYLYALGTLAQRVDRFANLN